MKTKIKTRLLISLIAVLINFNSFAQKSFSSDELLDNVFSIKSNTLVASLRFLAYSPCSLDDNMKPGFYIKDTTIDNNWRLIKSNNDFAFPYDVTSYENAVAYDNNPSFKGLSRVFKGKYKDDRLMVLIYEFEGKRFFDIFDVELKKIIQ